MTTDENSIALEYYNLCKAQNNFNCLFDLQSVKTKFDVQILAVAIEKKRPQKTKGTDYSASYLILDPTIADPLTLNVFKPNLKAFPTLNAKGNLISCKINIKEFGGKAQFTTSKPSQLAVLEKNSSLSITDKALSPLVDFLLKWIDSNFLQSDTPIEGRLSQKLSRRLISLHEINYTDNGCFVDMNCLVMRIGTFDGKKAEILVTNFTENENVMFNSSSDEKMSIAVELRKLNQIVFQKSDAFALKNCKNLFFLINLWGTEGEKYQNFLTEKKYYNFRNINLRVEENESCEGHLFPDQKYPNKHFVIEIYKGDEEYEDLERLRKKLLADNTPLTITDNTLELSKISTIKEATITSKFRCRGQIVDYRPCQLENFVIRKCNFCSLKFSKNTSCCSKCHSEDFKVAFDFSFLIFDGTGYLSLKVDSIDANILFFGSKFKENFEEKIYFEILEKIGVRNVPKGNNIFEPLDGVNFDFCVELIALEGEEKLYKLFNTVIYSDFLEELE